MNWGLLEDKRRVVFKIPVGNMSTEEIERKIRQLRKSYDPDKFIMEERRNKLDKIISKMK